MEGRGKPWNSDNFEVVSREILRTGPWNLAKFSVKKTVDPTNLFHFAIILSQLSAANLLFDNSPAVSANQHKNFFLSYIIFIKVSK